MCRKIPEITKFQEFFCFLLTERLKETWAKGLVKTLPHTGTGPKNKNSTEDMLKNNVMPYSNAIFEYGKTQPGVNLIKTTPKELALTLLPRTEGTFSRFGLRVNKLRYNDDDSTEALLKGGTCTAAYNPDDVSAVWYLHDGIYTKFELIESQFNGCDVKSVHNQLSNQRVLVKSAEEENLQAKLDLMEHIRVISDRSNIHSINIKSIRKARKKEQSRTHTSFIEVGEVYE